MQLKEDALLERFIAEVEALAEIRAESALG